MDTKSFNDIHLAQHWLSTVHSQESFALSMARMCTGDFADLILKESQKSKDNQPPQSAEELDLWQRRSIVLKSKISAIAHADSMARLSSGVASEILKATREYCDRSLPVTESELEESQLATAGLTATISNLCSVNSSR